MARKRISFLNPIQLLKKANRFSQRVFCFCLGLLLVLGSLPALSHLPATAQTSLPAEQLFTQGEQHYRDRDFPAAIQSLSAAAEQFQQAGKTHESALALTNLGNVQLEIGQAEAALTSWENSTALFSRLNDSAGILLGQLYQARALRDLGLFPRACATFGHALLGQTRLSCDVLGAALTDEAEQGIETAIATTADNPNLQAIALKSLGDTLRAVGELNASQIVLTHAINLNTLSETNQLALRLSLANTFTAKGSLERARRLPTRYDYIPWKYTTATDGALKAASQWYAKAAGQYQQVTATPSQNSVLKTQAQLNLLKLYIEGCDRTNPQCELRQTDGTMLAFSPPNWQTIDLTTLPPGQPTTYSHISLAKSLAYLKQLPTVEATIAIPTWDDVYQQLAIALQQTSPQSKSNSSTPPNQRTYAYALGNLGSFYEYCSLEPTGCDQGLSQAELLSQANQLTQSALLAAQPSDSPDVAYKWQWQLGRLQKQQHQLKAAIATYQSAVNTLKSIRGDLLVINSDVQFNFRDNVEPLYRELVDLLLTDADTESAAASGLEQALSNIDALRLDELVNFMGCDLTAASDNVEELAQDIDPHAAFIYPIILADRLDVIYKLPNQPLQHHVFRDLPHSQIEATIQALRDAQGQRNGSRTIKETAKTVYSWMIEPIEAKLSQTTEPISALVFLLDGSLRNIPMSYLIDARGHYLIEQYPVAVISSRQLFSTESRRTNTTILAAGVAESRTFPETGKLDAIPAVAKELEQIQSLNRNNREPLLNQAFTRESLATQIDLGDYSTVHVATHGEFNSDPEKTFLMAWDRLIRFKEFSEVLQINRHGKVSPIDLLVLSACKTASGDRRAALGLAGAAAQANVRTTLATLWKVNDQATGEFIAQFYTRLQSGDTVAKALQQTQIDFIHKSGSEVDYNRPYYWAPFILVGNWN